MDGGAWWAVVHGVMKSQTRLSDFPFMFHFHALEKEMATHSSVLASAAAAAASSLPQKEQYISFVYTGCWDTFSSLYSSQQSLLVVTLNLKDKPFVTKLQSIRGFFVFFCFLHYNFSIGH